MSAMSHVAVERLAASAAAHHAQYTDAIKLVHDHPRLHWLAAHRAKKLATVAVNDIPALTAELLHKLAETDIAHRHMVSATRESWRQQARADEANDEAIRLRAENDQLRRILRGNPTAVAA